MVKREVSSDDAAAFLLVLIACLVLVCGFLIVFSGGRTLPESDPRLGWTDTVPSKVCDGTTLVYSNGGIVTNSQECS